VRGDAGAREAERRALRQLVQLARIERRVGRDRDDDAAVGRAAARAQGRILWKRGQQFVREDPPDRDAVDAQLLAGPVFALTSTPTV
jgi:hypothetical protein